MRMRRMTGATIASLLLLPGAILAEDLAAVSDLDLIERTREAVEAQDAAQVLDLLTEMQRRGTGVFAGAPTEGCEEVIDLPATISDWRFRGAARQAYIIAAKERQLATSNCGCLFTGFPFGIFVEGLVKKAPSDLVDADRQVLEAYLRANQTSVEDRFRDLEQSCRVK